LQADDFSERREHAGPAFRKTLAARNPIARDVLAARGELVRKQRRDFLARPSFPGSQGDLL
jgi:hypothetical protein